jgi:hypothetical protein
MEINGKVARMTLLWIAVLGAMTFTGVKSAVVLADQAPKPALKCGPCGGEYGNLTCIVDCGAGYICEGTKCVGVNGQPNR